ncbi:MAG: hypothetical protein C4525_01370 [Desulfarculus sp.]|jgi:uncharacterized OB-fold protein|nr:MAG: hypothetical protein C4525_01370 [Desulfarculus sp.]
MAQPFEGPLSTEYIGTPLDLFDDEKAWVVKWPRSMEHHHTYGMLTPFFKGLTEGKLLATKCVNPKCPHKSTWLPPRADCPDCYARTEWVQVPSEGKIYAYTMLDYTGIGIEMKAPYWQIDVEIKGVDTIFKGFLLRGKPVTGLPVKAMFRTKNPTHTILDICWVPKED